MRFIPIGAAALAILAASAAPAPAQEECTPWSAQNEQAYMNDPDTRAAFSGTMLRDLRELRDAALTLRTYGMDDACRSVTDAIREIADNPEEMARRGMGEAPDPAVATTAMTFAQARPLSETPNALRAGEMIGSDVRGRSNDVVGEVTDIVFNTEGRPAYAVVAHGGFLGLGEDEMAVPFDHLRTAGNGAVLYVAMSEDELEEAPTFERGTFDWSDDTDWRARNDAYYDGL